MTRPYQNVSPFRTKSLFRFSLLFYFCEVSAKCLDANFMRLYFRFVMEFALQKCGELIAASLCLEENMKMTRVMGLNGWPKRFLKKVTLTSSIARVVLNPHQSEWVYVDTIPLDDKEIRQGYLENGSWEKVCSVFSNNVQVINSPTKTIFVMDLPYNGLRWHIASDEEEQEPLSRLRARLHRYGNQLILERVRIELSRTSDWSDVAEIVDELSIVRSYSPFSMERIELLGSLSTEDILKALGKIRFKLVTFLCEIEVVEREAIAAEKVRLAAAARAAPLALLIVKFCIDGRRPTSKNTYDVRKKVWFDEEEKRSDYLSKA